MIVKFILLFMFSVVRSQEVVTKFGVVKGELRKTKDGSALYVFYGIPYAATPISELRFKEPQEFTGKYPNNYLLATKPTRCVQFNVYGAKRNQVSGQEDCLHLNIYTTSLDSGSNYDVIFYIHGGEFVHGSGHTQSPEYLLDFTKKIVFVSINYRLGPFGFLTTGDDVVPGNMGLKDQVIALKWVKNNIKTFGGNPNNVVLIGASSGGSCVHLHYLSPMSRGMFTKGISVGGAAFSKFAFKDRNTEDGFKALLTLFPDCRKEDNAKSVECLSQVPASEIMDKLLEQDKPVAKDLKILDDFRPVVEKAGRNPFLNQHPYFLFKSHKVANVPWLLGMTSGEGLLPAGEYLLDESKGQTLDTNWNKMAPNLLNLVGYASTEDLDKISQQVRDHYLGNDPISIASKDKLIKLFGDRLHYVPLENSLRLHAGASKANTYMYMFDYKGTQSFTQVIFESQTYLGVSHIDDLTYILKIEYFQKLDKDVTVRRRLMNMWESFVQSGIPDLRNGVKWPPVSKDVSPSGDIEYMLIDEKSKVMSKPYLSDREFWDSLPIDELHLSGVPYVPKYIKKQKRAQKIPFSFFNWIKKVVLSWLNIFFKKKHTQ